MARTYRYCVGMDTVAHDITITTIPSTRAGFNRYRMTCTHCERKRVWYERENVDVDFTRYVHATYPDTIYTRETVVTFA